MTSDKQISALHFRKWLRQDSENRLLLLPVAAAVCLAFLWLKLAYPYPNFMPPDSTSYITAAFSGQLINTWPTGYSLFLRLFGWITHHHFTLVLFQYLILQGSLLYFLWSFRYLMQPGKWTFRILAAACILNPALLHISNFVSSDALFIALSLVWFTQLLWILYRPVKVMMLLHGIILLLAFMVRFTAVWYPLISLAVIGGAQLPLKVKAAVIMCTLLLPGIFAGASMYAYYTATGTIQYAAFGGWQLASNTLYGYAHARLTDPEQVPVRYRHLHAIVNRHMDSLQHVAKRPDSEVAIYYLWDAQSPLKQYLRYKWRGDNHTSYFKRWAGMGPLYSGYGRYLIMHYPREFIAYYVWPNFVKYYAPPAKFMAFYNMGNERVEAPVVAWFGWKNNLLPARNVNRRITVTDHFSTLYAIINLLFLTGAVGFVYLKGGAGHKNYHWKALQWTAIVWGCQMAFSVLSAPIELRYQLFSLIITLAFALWLIAAIVTMSNAVHGRFNVSMPKVNI